MPLKARDKAIAVLKKIGPLYGLARFFYWRSAALEASLFGTRAQEKKWAKRNIKAINNSFANLNHPHRDFLITNIAALSPFNDVLEIGCGYGANLYLLSGRFPDARFTGIDINDISVREGNKWLKENGRSNVQLIHARADDLGQFADKTFDIVFTDAILMYIGQDKILEVIRGISRVARKALIFLEQNHEPDKNDPHGMGIYRLGQWQRNYVELLKQFFSEKSISSERLPAGVWPGDDWSRLGYLVRVVI